MEKNVIGTKTSPGKETMAEKSWEYAERSREQTDGLVSEVTAEQDFLGAQRGIVTRRLSAKGRAERAKRDGPADLGFFIFSSLT